MLHKYLASSSCDKTIIIWDISQSFKQIKTLRGHTDCLNVLNYYKTKYFLSGSRDKTVIVWNADKLEILRVLNGNQGSVLSIASMNSYFAFGTEDNIITLFGDYYLNNRTIFTNHNDII